MDCKKAAALLYEFLDQELDEFCCQELKIHLEVCDKCRCHYAFEREIIVCVKRHGAREKASLKLKKKILKLIEKCR